MDLPSFLIGGVVGGLVIAIVQQVLNSVLVISLWSRAFHCGTPVSFTQLVMSQLRRNPTRNLIEALITLRQRGFDDVAFSDVEKFYLANQFAIQDAESLVIEFEHQASDRADSVHK